MNVYDAFTHQTHREATPEDRHYWMKNSQLAPGLILDAIKGEPIGLPGLIYVAAEPAEEPVDVVFAEGRNNVTKRRERLRFRKGEMIVVEDLGPLEE